MGYGPHLPAAVELVQGIGSIRAGAVDTCGYRLLEWTWLDPAKHCQGLAATHRQRWVNMLQYIAKRDVL